MRRYKRRSVNAGSGHLRRRLIAADTKAFNRSPMHDCLVWIYILLLIFLEHFFGTTGRGLRELIKNYICCNPTPLPLAPKLDFGRRYPILINVSLISLCHVEAKYLTIGTTTRRKQILKRNQPLPYFAQRSYMHCQSFKYILNHVFNKIVPFKFLYRLPRPWFQG